MSFPAIGIGSGVLGFRPYWCPSPSLRLPYLMFSIRSFCQWLSIVFLLTCIATHLVDPSLIYFLGEFPGFGTGSGTRCCGPRSGTAVLMEEKTRFKFLPWPG